MKNSMRVTVVPKGNYYEGFVQMPNLLLTKLRKENGSTLYFTVQNLRQAAKSVAAKYNSNLNFVVPVKVAAKKSSK